MILHTRRLETDWKEETRGSQGNGQYTCRVAVREQQLCEPLFFLCTTWTDSASHCAHVCKCAGDDDDDDDVVRGRSQTKTTKVVIVCDDVGPFPSPCLDYLESREKKTDIQLERGLFFLFFVFFVWFELSGQSRLRWKPPAISHRILSCWSNFECSTTSLRCNLQITIYGSVSSSGLSGSTPSSKTGQCFFYLFIFFATVKKTSPCMFQAEPSEESQKEMCLVVS